MYTSLSVAGAWIESTPFLISKPHINYAYRADI